ncbi:conjugal transfer protein TrbL family protein [Paenibacillus sp. 1P03SA]|uniref:conjugal transfer protein TrbL family protein n=1 Tax=Paenibacillus sp. 1P03SA TaxID=3132294 RepID=UPI0039A12A28
MIKTFINLVSGFLEFLAEESIKFVLTIFAYIGALGNVVLDMPVVQTGIIYTQIVALSWLALKIAYEAYMIYILRQMGEPTSDPLNLVIGAVRSASVIAVMPWLLKFMYSFSLTMASEIANLPGTGYEANESTFVAFTNLMTQAGSALIFIAAAILYAVFMMAIVVIQNFIRAGEIASAAWTGSISALGLTSKDSQGWQSWVKDTLVIMFAGTLQIALLRLSFYCLTPIKVQLKGEWVTAPSIINLFLFIATLWVTYKSPTTLKEKIHSTGIARVGGGAAQSVGQSLVMRTMMRK